MTTGEVGRAVRWSLAVASRIVPWRERERWLAEWTAEFAWWTRRGTASPPRTAYRIACAFGDALTLRREEGMGMGMGTTLSLIRVLKSFVRRPAHPLLVVVTLALGVGATSAIFSLADWALLRPLPGAENPDELVGIEITRDGGSGLVPFSHPTALALLDGSDGLLRATVRAPLSMDVRMGDEDPVERVDGEIVGPSYFETFGVRPWRGRFFDRAEASDPETAHAVAVVSHDFWRRAFGGDPEAPGRTFHVNGREILLVGVAPPGFQGSSRTRKLDLWVPASATPILRPRLPANVLSMPRAPLWREVVGRLRPGATVEQLETDLARVAAEAGQPGSEVRVYTGVGTPPGLRSHLSRTLGILGGLVAILLLLTSVNLVNLVVSRVSRGSRDTLVRKALGASSARLTGEMLVEALVLAAAGAGAALLVARGVLHLFEGARLASWMPVIGEIAVDVRVFTFTLLTAAGVEIVAVLAAAWGIQRLAPDQALRSRTGSVGSRSAVRRTLVAVQLALSLALVAGAGSLARSLRGLQSDALGYEPAGVLTFGLNPGAQGSSDRQADVLFRELVEELRDLPATHGASFAWLGPMTNMRYREHVTLPGGTEEDAIASAADMVAPGMFETLGMTVLDGRDFTEEEYLESERPERGDVILNRTLAERLFPGGGAVGRDVVLTGRHERAFRVVGVVEDARIQTPREEPGPALFDPFGNGYRTTSATFVVGYRGSRADALRSVRELVGRMAPELSIIGLRPLDEAVTEAFSEERLLTRLAALFGVLALILASTGLYGLTSESVHARLHEFGVRRALGAGTGRLLATVFRETAVLVAVGAVLGVLATTQVARLLSSRLWGVSGLEPGTLGLATAVLAGAALLAALRPALRSIRVDPVEVLRVE